MAFSVDSKRLSLTLELFIGLGDLDLLADLPRLDDLTGLLPDSPILRYLQE